MMATPTDAGVIEAAGRVQLGEWTSVALVEACLQRIEWLEPAVQAWAYLDSTAALTEAADRDADVRAGRPLGPLHGVPLGIKDLIDVAGMPTKAGAAAFAHRSPTTDATLVARLRDAGAVILGKTHATQFAYRDPAPTHNPWSLGHTPGGSSSGSAAAVAARMVPAAIGTQTVGSILRPAAYCGVVGFKGAYGTVPLDGVVPLSHWLDHAGPIARSVADVALLERILAREGRDVLAVPARRLGVVRGSLDRAEPELRRSLESILEQCHDAGADVVEVDLPAAFDALPDAGRVLLEAGAATFHAEMFAAHGDEYGPTIREIVLAGLARTSDEIAAAERTRDAARQAFAPVIVAVDAVVTPVAESSAPALTGGTGDGSLCAPWSTIGVPAITLPTGVDGDGLPLAIQLVGSLGDPSRLLDVAMWCERVIGFDARPPT
jgi:aspartyl-tRNA(Asn)/glutamyl-tRNA(Gln) amidotransferase subunit A